MPKRPTDLSMIPDSVPVFPLSGALLLPHTHRPLDIFEPRYLAMVDHMLATNRLLGLVQPVSSDEESPKSNQAVLQKTGCLGRLTHFEEMAGDRYFVVLEGITRFTLGDEIESDLPFRQYAIDPTIFEADFIANHGEEAVDRQKFLTVMRNYAEFADLDINWDEIEQTGTADLVNLACMISPYGAAEMQALLEAKTLGTRAETLIAMAELEMGPGLQ